LIANGAIRLGVPILCDCSRISPDDFQLTLGGIALAAEQHATDTNMMAIVATEPRISALAGSFARKCNWCIERVKVFPDIGTALTWLKVSAAATTKVKTPPVRTSLQSEQQA
jgi:hypothetical protein